MTQKPHNQAYIQKITILKDIGTPMFIAATVHNSQDMGATLMSVDR